MLVNKKAIKTYTISYTNIYITSLDVKVLKYFVDSQILHSYINKKVKSIV